PFPDNHVNYWRGKMSNSEHWRFEMGFLQGWNDGKLFFSFPGNTSLSEIGYKAEWTKRRVAEHAAAKGGGDHLWEFGRPPSVLVEFHSDNSSSQSMGFSRDIPPF
ncbi:10008_t:CDS:1, partial [Acaulospora colombiana]